MCSEEASSRVSVLAPLAYSALACCDRVTGFVELSECDIDGIKYGAPGSYDKKTQLFAQGLDFLRIS